MNSWEKNYEIGLRRRQFLINYINDLGSKLDSCVLMCRLLDDRSRINALRCLTKGIRKPSIQKSSKKSTLAMLCVDNNNRFVIIEVRMCKSKSETTNTYFHFKREYNLGQAMIILEKIYFLIIYNGLFILISGKQLVSDKRITLVKPGHIQINLSGNRPYMSLSGGGMIDKYGNIAEEIVKIL